MNNIEIICPEGLFKEFKCGLFRRVEFEVDEKIFNKFLRKHAYPNISKKDLKARYESEYNFLKQIEEHPLRPALKSPERIKEVTEEKLEELEEGIAFVLRVNEMRYCSFD